MKQPENPDVGTKMDVARHRLMVAREDLDTANLTFEVGKLRAANNRAYYSIFHTISAVPANADTDCRTDFMHGRKISGSNEVS